MSAPTRRPARPMRRAIPSVLLALAVCGPPLLVSGCWDLRELEQYLHVTALALDRGAMPGSVRVTILFQEPPSGPGAGGVGGGGGGGGGGGTTATRAPQGATTTTAEGPSFSVANVRLNSITNRIVTYSHVEIILFGEELARQGITPYVDAFVRSREFRRSVPMAVIDGATAEETLMSVRSDVESSPASCMSSMIMNHHDEYGRSFYIRLHDVIIAYEQPGEHIIMPMLRLAAKPPFPTAPGQSRGASATARS